jgi:patatin-like phospholipase/acyl hydrolase
MIDQKDYKILSIDGGGIKGLYSAIILERFEEEYGPLHRHFDLICGTSTGGIIALALAAGIPAKKNCVVVQRESIMLP